VKVREALQLLADDEWEVVATRGSHRQLRHATKPGRVTVAGNSSDDLHPKTAASILRQAGLRR
jgi:predicted RNA binding protein YcfA (HicA-like mRNA interferase family)